MLSTALISALAVSGMASAAPLQSRAYSGGQATFFDVGLGNCGWWSKPSDMVVALDTRRYGSTDLVSSWCGKTVHITNELTGISQDAKIVDSCPTCLNSNSLDMSRGLFAALGGTTKQGVFPISWSVGAGGSSGGSSLSSNNKGSSSSSKGKQSSSGSKSSSKDSKSKSNTKQQQQQAPASSPKKSKQKSKAAPAPSSTSSSAAAEGTAVAIGVASNSTTGINGEIYSFNATTGLSNQTVTVTPLWWASIDTKYCNVTAGANETIAAVGPSDNVKNLTNLNRVCGQRISVTNLGNNHTINATVTSWIPDAERNTLVLSTGYVKLAKVVDDIPNPIHNVTWHFIDA